MDKRFFLSLVGFFPLEKITNIKICHMVAKEHPEAIGGRQLFIEVDVIECEEAAEDDSIDYDSAA